MKPLLPIPISLLILLSSLSLWSQENPKTEKGKLAGINSHIGRYDDYVEQYGKLFYEKLYLPEAQIIEYLRLKHHPVTARRNCLVSPGRLVPLTFLNASVTSGWLEQEHARPFSQYRIPFTQDVFSLSNDRFLIRFYDNSGVIVNSKEDLDAMKKVRFIRLGDRHTSWRVELTSGELSQFLSETQVEEIQVTVQERVLPYQIYELPDDRYLYEPDPETENFGQLFENKLALLQFIHEESSYRSESVKYLLNQFLDGAVPPELYDYPFHLRKIQLEEIVLNHDGMTSKALSDSISRVYELVEGPVLYFDVRYNLARLFENREDLNKYRENMSARIESPELIFHSQLNNFGKKLPQEAPELINRLTGLLHIPPRVLDLSEKSLEEIDVALSWNYDGRVDEKLALPLLAYLGETLRKQLGGDWAMEYDKESESWQANIRDRSGKLHPLPYDVFIHMMEPDGQAPDLSELALQY